MRRQQFRSLVAVAAAVGLATAGASVASMASAATAGCRVTYTISSP
ncbi:hypothetical protein [Dactylosporangium matsuzakiense]|nr:hypothetical protein [Dactylosporangium matsuzakiense]UWZ50247.1 hypothetical protein Dmats_21055 [Dactylosporangium matsuzakiense]